MKIKAYAVICVLAVVVMAWPLMWLIMSPIGLFWLLPLLVSAFGLFCFTCIMKTVVERFAGGLHAGFPSGAAGGRGVIG